MAEGERGGQDVVVYKAKDYEDLRWWQLEVICSSIGTPNPTGIMIVKTYVSLK
ncbi:MAG: hypothetical protein J6S97_02775 [Bacteroidales bacterium]|nr:hypothetical protein [Bacteroidales bacterium]